MQLELGAAESTKNGNHRPKEMELGHKTALYGVRDITTFNVFRTPPTMSLNHSIRNTAIRRGRRAATSKVLPGKGFRIYNCRPRSTKCFDQTSRHVVHEILEPTRTKWVPDFVFIFPNRKSSPPLSDVGRMSLGWDA